MRQWLAALCASLIFLSPAMAGIPPIPPGPPPTFTAVQLHAQKVVLAALNASPAQVNGSPPTELGPGLGVSTASIVVAGTGYSAGCVVSLGGGTLLGGGSATTVKVLTVSGGIPQTIAVVFPGNYTTSGVPTSPAITSTVSGSCGAGLTINPSGSSGSMVLPGHSTSPASAQIQPSDPRLQQMSGVLAVNPNFSTSGYTGQYISASLGSASFTTAQGGDTHGWGFRFASDAAACDVILNTTTKFIAYTTDLTTGIRTRAATNDFSTTASNWSYSITFSSHAARLWEFYFGAGSFVRGFDCDATSTVWGASPSLENKAVVVSDSYGTGFQATNRVRGSFVYSIGNYFNAPGILSNSVGGTGVLATNAGVNNTFDQRVAYGNLNRAFIGDMDIVFAWPVSINDQGQSDAAVQAALAQEILDLQAAQPNAFLCFTGPQFVPNNQTSSARYAAVKATILAAPSYGSTVFYIDNSPATGAPFQTGLGNVSAPTGSGNADNFVVSDNTHLNDAGYQNLGQQEALSCLNKIKAVSGLF